MQLVGGRSGDRVLVGGNC